MCLYLFYKLLSPITLVDCVKLEYNLVYAYLYLCYKPLIPNIFPHISLALTIQKSLQLLQVKPYNNKKLEPIVGNLVLPFPMNITIYLPNV